MDTVDVFIDGLKVDTNNKTNCSKAEFVFDVENGNHEITIVKKPNILGNKWKKQVVLDWLLGIYDWTLSEKQRSVENHTILLNVKVIQDIQINLKLIQNGFELCEHTEEILNVKRQVTLNKLAEKRTRNSYMFPLIALSITIEVCILFVCVFLVTRGHYVKFTIIFSVSVFWICLCGKYLFNKRDK